MRPWCWRRRGVRVARVARGSPSGRTAGPCQRPGRLPGESTGADQDVTIARDAACRSTTDLRTFPATRRAHRPFRERDGHCLSRAHQGGAGGPSPAWRALSAAAVRSFTWSLGNMADRWLRAPGENRAPGGEHCPHPRAELERQWQGRDGSSIMTPAEARFSRRYVAVRVAAHPRAAAARTTTGRDARRVAGGRLFVGLASAHPGSGVAETANCGWAYHMW
jgi:hypothetical protein